MLLDDSLEPQQLDGIVEVRTAQRNNPAATASMLLSRIEPELTAAEEKQAVAITPRPQKQRALGLRLVDHATGKPLAGVGLGAMSLTGKKLQGRTDVRGRVSFVGLGSSVVSLVAGKLKERKNRRKVTRVEPSRGSRYSPLKWYVNQSEDQSRHQGEQVEVKAYVSPASGGVLVTFQLKEHWKNAAGGGARLVTTTATTDSTGVARVRLALSHCGLDRFRVTASVEGRKKKSGWIQVWRKLFYQETRMKGSSSFPFKNVTGEFDDYSIELVSSGAVVTAAHKKNLETKELRAFGRKYRKKRQTPFEAHVVLIDRQWDSMEEKIGGVQSVPRREYSVSRRLWSPSPWLVSAEWKEHGDLLWNGGGISVSKVSDWRVAVDLGSTGVDPTKTTVLVRVKVKLVKGTYAGDASYKPHVFIALAALGSNNSKAGTLNHELGHLIGLVPATGHSLHHDGRNGGMGDHCRHRASPNEVSLAQGGTFSGEYVNGRCVMYHTSTGRYAFCRTCGSFIRRCKLHAADMKSLGWG